MFYLFVCLKNSIADHCIIYGMTRLEYDAFLKSQKEAREQQRESVSQAPEDNSQSASSSLRSSHSSPSKFRPIQRPSTPPSPASSVPLPPSPTVANSPSKQKALSSERDLERFRKGTTTATTSPRKNRRPNFFRHDEDDEEEQEDARQQEQVQSSSRESTPTRPRSSSKNTSPTQDTPKARRLDDDSELEEPSSILSKADISRTSMSFATPPRPRPGHQSRNNMFKTPPRPSDLPDLPSLPGSPESPFVVRTSTPVGKGKSRAAGSFDQDWAFPTGTPSQGDLDAITSNDATTEIASPDGAEAGDSSVPKWVGHGNHLKTPKPPGAWSNGTPAPLPNRPFDPETPGQETNGVDSSLPNATFANVKTPAPPGSWAVTKAGTSLSAPVFGPPATPSSEALAGPGFMSLMQTPAPPGGWSSSNGNDQAAGNTSVSNSGNNSLRKGILKVRFDETSAASWAELQRMTGDGDAQELPNQFSLSNENGHGHGHEKIRMPLPAGFQPNGNAVPPDAGPSTASGSRNNVREADVEIKSPGGTLRKRKSRLRMVDEFGNPLPDPPEADEEGDEEEEISRPESPPHVEDDLPATAEEIRGLRRVARTVPKIAKDFADKRYVSISGYPNLALALYCANLWPSFLSFFSYSMSMTVPTPLMSLADQVRSNDKIADLNEVSKSARTERAKIQRSLQLARNSADSADTGKFARLQRAIRGSPSPSRGPKSRFRRWAFVAIILQAVIFFLLLRCVNDLTVRSEFPTERVFSMIS